MTNYEIFFALIRTGLHLEESISLPAMNDSLWAEIFAISVKQCMTGVMLEAIDRIGNNDGPGEMAKIRLMQYTIKAEKINLKADMEAAKWTEYFSDKGFTAILLKGQGLALLYPNPKMRTPGDTDLWILGDRKNIWELCRDELGAKEFTYHHIGIHSDNGMELEIHTTPSWMYCPWRNDRLQRMFKKWANECVKQKLPNNTGIVWVPSDEMNRIFLLVHLYRHVFSEGIGLKQMADYAMFLNKGCNDDERKIFIRQTKELNLYRFAGAVMYVIKKVFGLKDEKLLVNPNAERGEKLLTTIMEGGSFGKYDKSIDRSIRSDSIMSFITRNKRNMKLLKEYPEEVIWSPAFKIWHWVWRKLQKSTE